MRIVMVEEDPRSDRLAALVRAVCPGASLTRTATPSDGGAAAADVVVIASGNGAPSALHGRVLAAREKHPDVPVLVIADRDAADGAVAAMKAGAADYVVWRDDGAAVGAALAAHLRQGEKPQGPRRAAGDGLAGLVGQSQAMEQVRTLVRTAARTDAHVLIEGETGTGKEVVARAIHALGRRAAAPFVPVNCAAIPEPLAESEFFGHARGAFTGAVQDRPGALRLADRGTLFLDEIEDLSLPLQAKLLRVVQDREVRPLGASAARRVDLRLIAASNRDLWAMVEAGGFRRDLFYRLRVLALRLPALRQRRDDIPALAAHFLARFNQRHGTTFGAPGAAALRPLVEHDWPGNVRELENTLEALLTVAQASGTSFEEALRARGGSTGFWGDERTRIMRVLDEHRWNRQRAAHALGISRVTLWRWMERHGIRDPLCGPSRETG